MRKVVHIIIGLNIGGAELMLKRLVLNSNKSDSFSHEVISLTDLGLIGQDLEKHGIQVYTLGMTSIVSLPKIYVKLVKLLKNIRPDIVQTWMYHADFIGGLAAKQVGIKKIIWGIRTTDVTQGGSKLTVALRGICAKLSYRIPTDIICAAHVSKDIHIQVGYDPSKMHVIPNGFELDKLVATEQDRENLRREFNIPSDAIVLGSVGRFNVVKNQKFFVDVAALLVKKYPKLIFMMVGRDNTTDNAELMSWINEHNLASHFRLLGQRQDIPVCLKAMDIFCLHSKTEGFPNVLGEAMAIGVLPVALNVGDAEYLLGISKYIANNSEDMVNIINNAITQKDYSSEIISFNKNRILNYFALDSIVKKYENLYLEA